LAQGGGQPAMYQGRSGMGTQVAPRGIDTHPHSHQIRDRYPKASDISSPPCLLRLLPAGTIAERPLRPLEKRRLSRHTPKAVLQPRLDSTYHCGAGALRALHFPERTPSQAAACAGVTRSSTPRAAAYSIPVTTGRAHPNASHMRAEKFGYSRTGPVRLA
jgi:hypothetical protein